jgi:cyclic pyranopterin phosphate synthase
MKSIKWDKFRILVTNHCNYRCPFCHNEGQEKAKQVGMMSTNSFKLLIDYVNGENLSEINFSGGEPFLHKDIVDMIIYADKHMACDISCSTNLSLITDEQINRLAKTRLKFNIQFPFISENDFANSTGVGKLYSILDQVKTVKSAGIKIGLNTVIQSVNNEAIEQMIRFALENELSLKFLPQIGLSGSNRFIDSIQPILQKYAVRFVNKGTGALKWMIQNANHQTSVLYINSPCFSQDIATCRNYGEIRIQPDFKLQCCIMKKASEQLRLEKGKEFVINQFEKLWNGFNQC